MKIAHYTYFIIRLLIYIFKLFKVNELVTREEVYPLDKIAFVIHLVLLFILNVCYFNEALHIGSVLILILLSIIEAIVLQLLLKPLLLNQPIYRVASQKQREQTELPQ